MNDTELRTCKKCGGVKEINEFVRVPRPKKTYYTYTCKKCVSEQAKAKWFVRREEYRKKYTPEVTKELRRRFKERHGAEYINTYQREYYKNNIARRIRARVYGRLHYAIRTGKIIAGIKCEQCGKEHCKIESHHEDYNKPLEVKWLCTECHGLIHTSK